jgi:hypothetical protein
LVVEAVLVPGLVSSGMPLSGAISTMLIYRLISWLLLAAVGWVMFFFMFRTENGVDPDALEIDPETGPEIGPETGPGAGTGTGATNGTEAMPVDAADAALEGPVPPNPVVETGETPATRERRGAAQN